MSEGDSVTPRALTLLVLLLGILPMLKKTAASCKAALRSANTAPDVCVIGSPYHSSSGFSLHV